MVDLNKLDALVKEYEAPMPAANKAALGWISERLKLRSEMLAAFPLLLKFAIILYTALLRSRAQFLYYANQHDAKGTPESSKKAQVNRNYAAMIDRAMKGIEEKPDENAGVADPL